MWHFIAIVVSFAVLPIGTKVLKLKLGPLLLVTGLLLNLLAWVPAFNVLDAFILVFTTRSSLRTILCVVLIGMMGNLLKHYGMLTKMVEALKQLIASKKLLIMLIPAMFGILTVPGGAFLSAPFVDDLGKDLEIPPENRATINLSFRHIAQFLYPFSTPLLFIAAVVPGLNLPLFILMNLGFVIWMQAASYYLFFFHGKASKAAKTPRTIPLGQAMKDVLLYASPIYMVVVFNAVFGLSPPISLALCLVLACLLCNRKDLLRVLRNGLSLDVPLMLIGVFFIQNSIHNLYQISDLFLHLFANTSGIAVLLTIALGSLFLGVITGYSLAPMGIFLPMMLTFPLTSAEQIHYTFFIWLWAFIGYYFSPLHLCQLLTIRYIGVETGKVYRSYSRLIPWVAAGSFALFYLYRALSAIVL